MRGGPKGRARLILRRAVSIVRRAVDLFPLTPLGLLVVAGAALALLRYGIQRVDLILLVVGAVMLAIGALVLLAVVAAAVGLRLRLRKLADTEALQLECGFSSATGFSLPSLWYVPFVKLSWSWVEPHANVAPVKRRRRWHEHATPTRRGIYEQIVRRVEVCDAFGLAKIALRIRQERVLRLLPSVGALKNMTVVRSIASGEDIPFPGGQPEGERADLRRYVPGDPVRFVLWKVFAKSRQLVVRTPEQAISPARQTYAYLVAGEADEAAAGTARVAVDTGALGSSWALGADGVADVAKGKTHALEVIARSAGCPPDGWGSGLAAFLKKHAGVGSRVIVFVPGSPGPWVERVAAAARTRSLGSHRLSDIEFVVCTDGVERGAKTSWLKQVALLRPKHEPRTEAPPTAASDITKVIGALGRSRAGVLLVDRRAGRVYGEAHRQALMQSDVAPLSEARPAVAKKSKSIAPGGHDGDPPHPGPA